jgi:hypothetical protein
MYFYKITKGSSKMKALLLAASSFFFAAVFAEKVPFEKYSHVVSRYPFGVPPQGFDPNVSPKDAAKNPAAEAESLTQEQQSLKQNVSFSVINVASDGSVMVGFSDNTNPKAPYHYYVKKGETQDGWHVKEADVKERSVVLVKDGIELPLSLGTNQTAEKKPATAKSSTPAPPTRLNASRTLSPSSFLGRRAKRQKEEAAAAERKRIADAEQKKKEEDAAAERENNRLIREEQTRQLEALKEEFLKVREEKKRAANNSNEENNY